MFMKNVSAVLSSCGPYMIIRLKMPVMMVGRFWIIIKPS